MGKQAILTGGVPSWTLAMPLELESLRKSVGALRSVLTKSDDRVFMEGLDSVARND